MVETSFWEWKVRGSSPNSEYTFSSLLLKNLYRTCYLDYSFHNNDVCMINLMSVKGAILYITWTKLSYFNVRSPGQSFPVRPGADCIMTMSERKSAVSRWSLNSCFQLGRQGYSITLTVFIFRVIIVYNYKEYSSIYTHYFNSNIDTCSLLLEIRERPSQVRSIWCTR